MATNLEITPFDAADYLGSKEAQIAFLNDALSSGHPGVIANAIGAVARAQSRANGLGQLARDTGIKRQTLNKSLSAKGNPTVETILPVLDALGLRIKVESKPRANAKKGARRRPLAAA
jgi:probable addiction module antidote protein